MISYVADVPDDVLELLSSVELDGVDEEVLVVLSAEDEEPSELLVMPSLDVLLSEV